MLETSARVPTRQEVYISGNVTRVLGAVGVLFVVYQLVGYTTWMLSPGFAPPPRGDSLISPEALAGVRFAQLTQIVSAGVWSLFLIISWLKLRRLTWPMALSIGWIAVYWQDPLVNIVHHDFSYNAYFFNRGDWGGYLPFLPYHTNVLSQPLLVEGLVFYWQISVFALLTSWLMGQARQGLGIQNPWILSAIGWSIMVIADFLWNLVVSKLMRLPGTELVECCHCTQGLLTNGPFMRGSRSRRCGRLAASSISFGE